MANAIFENLTQAEQDLVKNLETVSYKNDKFLLLNVEKFSTHATLENGSLAFMDNVDVFEHGKYLVPTFMSSRKDDIKEAYDIGLLEFYAFLNDFNLLVRQ